MTETILPVSPRTHRRRRALRRFTRRPPAVVGLVGVAVVVLVAAFAPLIAPYDPAQGDYSNVFLAPFSPGHLLGTDDLGRDLFSRIVMGSRASILAGVAATLLAVLVAVPIGLAAGYYRGPLDTLVMRATDVTLAFPFLVVAVGLAVILGPSLSNAIFALAISAIPGFVRITRAEVLGLREQDYVQAAIVNGAPDGVILLQHILRNSLSPLVVQLTVTIPASILGEAALSYLGIGVQPPTASWGIMLSSAQNYITQAPWYALLPGTAIAITALSFNLLGDGLRDILDPRTGK
ncbi:ABC transporter permease [Pseudonocardia sp.]|jgi:peptide/nickel transport system permease protein|uniref:ABC transporter permease n=1 Tax=Pseudonocardia sp. TaxID=60912 RepID=UPI0031FDB4D7